MKKNGACGRRFSFRVHELQAMNPRPSCGEVGRVRQHVGHLRRGDSEPRCKRRCVLHYRRGRQQVAAAHVVRAAQHGIGPRAVEVATLDRAADDEVVRAPAVIRAFPVRIQCATEVGRGKRRHAIGHAQRDGRLIERRQRIAEFRHAATMAVDQSRMLVEATDRRHEIPDGASPAPGEPRSCERRCATGCRARCWERSKTARPLSGIRSMPN